MARLEIFPDPKKHLRQRSLPLFKGLPLILRFRNTGRVPVQIEELTLEDAEFRSLDWGDWETTARTPWTVAPGQETEMRRHHQARPGTGGTLTALTSVGRFTYQTEGVEVPDIYLVNDRGHRFHLNTPAPQRCAIDEQVRRCELRLGAATSLVLTGPPRCEPASSLVRVESNVSHSEFPVQLTPEFPLEIVIHALQRFPEEGHSLRLLLPIELMGEMAFDLNLRFAQTPHLQVNLHPPALTTQSGGHVVSGSTLVRPVTASILHRRGSPLKIESITSTEPWLVVTDGDLLKGVVLNPWDPAQAATEANQRVVKLQVLCARIPQVTEPKQFSAAIVIEGLVLSDDEPFQKEIPFYVQVLPPRKMTFPLAIDFGSTNSCLAYLDPTLGSGSPSQHASLVAIEEIRGARPEIPTALQFMVIANPGQKLEILGQLGSDLQHLRIGDSQETVIQFGSAPASLLFDNNSLANEGLWRQLSSICWGFKRFLQQPKDEFVYRDIGMSGVRLGGMPYDNGINAIALTPVEQVAVYLSFLLTRFREIVGAEPREVILTYPAIFNLQKPALREAAELAFGERITTHLTISEPEAIAVYHCQELQRSQPDLLSDLIIGVFDCGGGTTDISIVRFRRLNGKDRVELLASDGDNELGGDILTFTLARHFYEKLVPEQYRHQFPFPRTLREGLSTNDETVKANFMLLFNPAERIKKNTSAREFLGDEEFETHGNVGILDLLLDSVDGQYQVKWPALKLKGIDGGTFNAAGLARDIDGAALPELAPIDGGEVRETLSAALVRGFSRLEKMQKELFERKTIDSFRLHRLVLAGNSSRLRIVEELARDQNLVQADEIVFPAGEDSGHGLKISVAAGAAIYGTTLADVDSQLEIAGVLKLNYPIGLYNAFAGFRPLFQRWLRLDGTSEHRYESSWTDFAAEPPPDLWRLRLWEWFDTDYHKPISPSTGREIGAITVPGEELREASVASCRYVLLLRGDPETGASLYYNFEWTEDSEQEPGLLWPEFRRFKNFSHS